MSEKLKPCPFCGGEARIIANPYVPKVCVGCDDDTCLGFSGLGWLYDSEQEAAEAWNRRAGRTCYPVLEDETLVCSECGEDIDGYGWNYCPNCGARIEEEVYKWAT